MFTLGLIQSQLVAALTGMIADPSKYAKTVKPSKKFGDYVISCALPMSRELRIKPRILAQRIIDKLDVGSLFEVPTISGPGFINLKRSPS